jgi:hypothetical protein
LLSMHEAVQKWELQDMIYGQGTWTSGRCEYSCDTKTFVK